MDTKLPFLPFCKDEESKQFAMYVLENNAGPIVDKTAAVDWCRFADGKTIYTKPPSQIRIHVTKIDWNQRLNKYVSREQRLECCCQDR